MIKKRIIDILPFFLGGAAIFITFMNWKYSKLPHSGNFLEYLLNQKTELCLALITLFAQYIVTILIFKEIEAELSGKWNITVSPISWKGATDNKQLASIVGKGTLLLSKTPDTKDSYSGILQVTFTQVLPNGVKTELHKGAYEIVLDRSRNLAIKFNLKNLSFSLFQTQVTGWSLATVEDRSSKHLLVDEDYPAQNKCIYTLEYMSSKRLLLGNAKMKDSDSESEFDARKID